MLILYYKHSQYAGECPLSLMAPLRVSSLRSFGLLYLHHFFRIDPLWMNLLKKAGKDPLEFPFSHLEDERGAIAVVN